MALNVTVADFSGGGRKTATATLWQYDYGQILQFDGIDLPASYEVHFGNDKDGGYTKTQIGDEDGVPIPDEYFLTGQPIYAWLFLHAAEDDGETEYQVTIPINRRSRPADYAPTAVEQSAITQAIAALNTAVTAAETAQEKAEEAQGKAEDAEQAIESMNATASTLPEGSSATVEKTVDPDTGAVTLDFGIPAGDTGESAYEYAQAGGYTGTEQQFNRDLADVSDKYEKPSGGIPKTDLAEAVQTSLDKADTALQAVPDTYRTAAAQDMIDGAQDTAIAAKYTKPSGGIPKTDLASGVQSSLGKADTALQAVPDTYRTAAAQDVIDGAQDTAIAAKYTKPSGGIPASDLAAAVQTSLDKADTALQAVPDNYRTAAAQDVIDAAKADKVTGATAGDVAVLDASGNLADGGRKYNPVPKDETMPLRVGVDSSGRLWASGDPGGERFGVRGVGGASTSLTRLWDAAGLSSTPGTDQTACVSDFDVFPVFNRRKCVGNWSVVNGKAVFAVQAYEGDADYAEDGSIGDYVAVDVPPTYWLHDETTGTLGVSGSPHPGWEPHPICLAKDGTVREHTYLPAYALALKEGHAVCLPGYDNSFGCYKDVWDAARTYGNGTDFADFATIEPSVVDHYEWLLMTIEFATTNMQDVINGAVSMAYNASHTIKSAPAANKLVLTAAIGNEFVVGQTIYIGATYNATPSGVSAYNHITAIERCDADGTPNASGSYRLITYDGADRTASITANTTQMGSRPWITGATAGFALGVAAVQGHTGSPVSNSDGKHPFRYRWRENLYGNQNKTCLDLFDARTADGNSHHLDWYYNDNLRFYGATLYYPSSASKPELSDLQTAANGFKKLATTTTKEHYADGYIKEEDFDADLPCIRIPTVTGSPASATSYYADYAYLVNSNAVRAVRRRGYLSTGAFYGPRYVTAHYAPSYADWYCGADLYMAQ